MCNTVNDTCVLCLGWSDCGYLYAGCGSGFCGQCNFDRDCPPNQSCLAAMAPNGNSYSICVCNDSTGCGGDQPNCASPGGAWADWGSTSGCGCNGGAGQCPSGYVCGQVGLDVDTCVPSCVTDAGACSPFTGYPACDSSTGQCVACLTSQDCTGSYTYCLPGGTTAQNSCVGCLGNADCTGDGGQNTCDPNYHDCDYNCVETSDCGNICDPSTASCVDCLSAADCRGATTGTACIQGQCGCATAADCVPDGGTPFCLYGYCGACRTNSDCGQGAVCFQDYGGTACVTFSVP